MEDGLEKVKHAHLDASIDSTEYNPGNQWPGGDDGNKNSWTNDVDCSHQQRHKHNRQDGVQATDITAETVQDSSNRGPLKEAHPCSHDAG